LKVPAREQASSRGHTAPQTLKHRTASQLLQPAPIPFQVHQLSSSEFSIIVASFQFLEFPPYVCGGPFATPIVLSFQREWGLLEGDFLVKPRIFRAVEDQQKIPRVRFIASQRYLLPPTRLSFQFQTLTNASSPDFLFLSVFPLIPRSVDDLTSLQEGLHSVYLGLPGGVDLGSYHRLGNFPL